MLTNNKTLETFIVFKVSFCTFVPIMEDKIREKAMEMFLNYGFKSVTMDDLAQAIGISKKTIYAVYQNKTELVEACVMSKFSIMKEGINKIISLKKNPIEEVFEIKQYVMNNLKNQKSSPQYQLTKYYPRIFAKFQKEQWDIMQHCAISNIERGMALGLYRSDLHVQFIFRIYFAGINYLKDPIIFPSEKFSMVFLMESYLEYHLRAIVSPEGLKKLNEIINSNHQ